MIWEAMVVNFMKTTMLKVVFTYILPILCLGQTRVLIGWILSCGVWESRASDKLGWCVVEGPATCEVCKLMIGVVAMVGLCIPLDLIEAAMLLELCEETFDEFLTAFLDVLEEPDGLEVVMLRLMVAPSSYCLTNCSKSKSSLKSGYEGGSTKGYCTDGTITAFLLTSMNIIALKRRFVPTKKWQQLQMWFSVWVSRPEVSFRYTLNCSNLNSVDPLATSSEKYTYNQSNE